MRAITFEGKTWDHYEDLRRRQPQMHKNLVRILKELQREDPAKGTGKPEPLKYSLAGLWSRRLSQRDRVIYRFSNDHVYIMAIGGHYDINF